MPAQSKLSTTDWNAIKWYLAEFDYKLKDMIVWPIVRLRNQENEIVDINISDIKAKYNGRKKAKKTNA